MNKYLVTYIIEGKICEPVIETAIQIFNKMDMDDCYDIDILDLEWIKPWENVDEWKHSPHPRPKCYFEGTWSCCNPETNRIDPLRMEIRMMFGEGLLLDVGYGTDH